MTKNSSETKTTLLGLLASSFLVSGCASKQSLKPFVVNNFNNNQTQESHRWKRIKEKIKVQYSPADIEEIEYSGIQRTDGFIILAVGMDRNNQETFLCKDAFGEFKFLAQRWNEQKFTDTYVVEAIFFPRRWMLDEKLNKDLILSHVKDIEDGLLNYPATQLVQNQHVKKVVFNLNSPGEKPLLVPAEEI